MMDLYAKCGSNCGRCALYEENLTDEKRKWCAGGMARYINWKPDPERLRQCAGCQATDGFLYIKSCAVRRCAQYNGIDNCAHCSVFPCEYVPTVSVSVHYRERVAERLGSPIPEDDYLAFIEPYEGVKHLEELRTSLSAHELVEPAEVRPLRARLAKLPDELPVSEEEAAAYRALYRLMTDVICGLAHPYVRQLMLHKRRKEILNLLWVFGRYGDLDEQGSCLVIDGSTYGKLDSFINIVRKGDNTLHSSTAESVRLLQQFGVSVEHVPLGKKTWLLNLSFDETAGGIAAMKALRSYVARLVQDCGEPHYAGSSRYKGEAYTRFSRVNMGNTRGAAQ